MFTANSLEPRNILPDIMKVIECHEIRSMQLPQAVYKIFRGHRESSPVWVLVNGNGTYIHGDLKPCKKHNNGQKIGHRCITIFDYNVHINTKCYLPRMTESEYSQWLLL